jgi:uncharacterized protein RhaS with RHS repeats
MRHYSPTLGRWISVDPLGLGPDTNWYRDVGNDPTNATDPSGLQAKKLFAWDDKKVKEQQGNAAWRASEKGKMKVKVITKKEQLKDYKEGTWLKFVVTKDGDLVVAEVKQGDFAEHIALTKKDNPEANEIGADVVSAGWIHVGKDGKLQFDVQSGHYKTHERDQSKAVEQAEEKFKELNLDIKPIEGAETGKVMLDKPTRK